MMETPRVDPAALREGLQLASEGVGPLVQRDYWCVIRESRMRPPELVSYLRLHFAELPPEALGTFRTPHSGAAGLDLGDEMEILLPGAGAVAVRVVHLTSHTLTVATLRGHPIAGRITFGAYPNARGDVIIHIRSRSRAASTLHRLGHFAAGDAMQSTTWTDFLDRLANTVGAGVIGAIHEESREVPEEVERRDPPLSPTFSAEGG
jgi:hypothetical protein